MRLFGFEIFSNKKDENIVSFAPQLYDDGAIQITSQEGYATGGAYGISLDMDSTIQSESDLVTRYRSMAMQAEIQQSVEEIANAAICIDTFDDIVDINLDDIDNISEQTKKKMTDEFKNITSLLNFPDNAYEVFQRWYVDGRINFHVIIDEANLKRGIIEIRYLDPRKIKLIRETEDVQTEVVGVTGKKIKNEYYVYSDNAFGSSTVNNNSLSSTSYSAVGVRIAKDSIVRVTSGLTNENNTLVLSYLHKAIKPLNNLRMLEDSKIIYTLIRTPERKVFYVDVGNLPKAKAEQYLYDMMARHKNKMVYDANTGEVKDDRKFMSMSEDYWFPRREGNRSTEIDVLAGGSQLTDNDDLGYYLKKLYKALNVPSSRLEPETMYAFGRPSEMSREEVKFNKFIRRLRSRFATLFTKLLEKQLVLKGIITPDDFAEIRNKIKYNFMSDNYFEEMKEIEVLREKMSMLRDVDENVGKYFSRDYVFKKVLFMTDEEKQEVLDQIEKERDDGIYDEDLGGVDIAGEGGDDTTQSNFGGPPKPKFNMFKKSSDKEEPKKEEEPDE